MNLTKLLAKLELSQSKIRQNMNKIEKTCQLQASDSNEIRIGFEESEPFCYLLNVVSSNE